MSIETLVTTDGSTLVIKMDDKFDFGKVQAFRNAYEPLPEGISCIEVDLGKTDYMDSSALGMLLNMQKSLKNENLTYKISNCRPSVARILSISRFDKKFAIS